MKLYLIRHGETDWNVQGRMQGQTDIALNQNGIDLARVTAQGMADIPLTCVLRVP